GWKFAEGISLNPHRVFSENVTKQETIPRSPLQNCDPTAGRPAAEHFVCDYHRVRLPQDGNFEPVLLEGTLSLNQLTGSLVAGCAHPADKDARPSGISPIVFPVPNDRSPS